MRRSPTLLLTWFLLAPAAFCQGGPPDTQVTQALLNEVRQLRNDLHITAITMQRVQIVMARLQAQAQMVSRATQRLDEVRNRCSTTQQDEKRLTVLIEQNEPRLLSTQDPIEKKRMEDAIAQIKANLAQVSTQEQNCRQQEGEAEIALRAEQVKMDGFQDQLDKLDKTLASLSGQ